MHPHCGGDGDLLRKASEGYAGSEVRTLPFVHRCGLCVPLRPGRLSLTLLCILVAEVFIGSNKAEACTIDQRADRGGSGSSRKSQVGVEVGYGEAGDALCRVPIGLSAEFDRKPLLGLSAFENKRVAGLRTANQRSRIERS